MIEQIKPLLNKLRDLIDNKLMDVDETANYLKVTKAFIYEKTHAKKIPYHKVGKFPRFRKNEIDKWLENPYPFTLCADKPLKRREVKI